MDELESFPSGKFKDQVDAASGAFNKLALMSNYNWSGSWI
jgi:phage terminase large subunit-like protein